MDQVLPACTNTVPSPFSSSSAQPPLCLGENADAPSQCSLSFVCRRQSAGVETDTHKQTKPVREVHVRTRGNALRKAKVEDGISLFRVDLAGFLFALCLVSATWALVSPPTVDIRQHGKILEERRLS